MTSYDFEVDLESLINASTKASEAVKQKKDQDIEDIVPTESDVGSDTVWKAVDDFQDRCELRGFRQQGERAHAKVR